MLARQSSSVRSLFASVNARLAGVPEDAADTATSEDAVASDGPEDGAGSAAPSSRRNTMSGQRHPSTQLLLQRANQRLTVAGRRPEAACIEEEGARRDGDDGPEQSEVPIAQEDATGVVEVVPVSRRGEIWMWMRARSCCSKPADFEEPFDEL